MDLQLKETEGAQAVVTNPPIKPTLKPTARLRNKYSFFLSMLACALLFLFYGITVVSFNTIFNNLSEVFGWSESEKMLYNTVNSTMITLANLIGCLGGPSLSYRTGRYKLIITTIPIASIGLILTAIKNTPVMIIGRFIANLGSGIFQGVAPILNYEMSPLETQGISSAFVPYFLPFGIFVGFLIGLGLPAAGSPPGEYWRFVSLFPLIPGLISLIILIFNVKGESGKFIYMKYKDEERARKALERVYKKEAVDGELLAIKADASVVSSSLPIRQLLRQYRKQISVGFAINLAGIGVGILHFSLFSNTLIDKMESLGGATIAESTKTAQFFTVLCGVLELVGNTGSLLWLARFRRKRLFFVIQGLALLLLTAIWVLGFAGVYTAQKYFLMLSFFTYGAGLAQFLYLYTPATMIDSAFGIVVGGFWALSLIDTSVFPILINSRLGVNGTLVIYWGIGVIASIYFLIFAPEIKGKTQAEIFNYFNKSPQPQTATPFSTNTGIALTRNKTGEQFLEVSKTHKPVESLPTKDTLIQMKEESNTSNQESDQNIQEGVKVASLPSVNVNTLRELRNSVSRRKLLNQI